MTRSVRVMKLRRGDNFWRDEKREMYGAGAVGIAHSTVWLGSKGFIGLEGSYILTVEWLNLKFVASEYAVFLCCYVCLNITPAPLCCFPELGIFYWALMYRALLVCGTMSHAHG